MATIEAFQAIDIRAGRVIAAAPLAGARRPALCLTIDFGPELGERQSTAQITALYTPEALTGRQVLAVVNLPPRRVAGARSEVLVLGLSDAEGRVVLACPDSTVPEGAPLH